MNASIRQFVPLQSNNYSVEPETVNVSLSVQRFTGHVDVLPVHALHLPEGLHLRLMPKQVQVTYRMPLYAKQGFPKPILKAEVDLKQLHDGAGKLKVLVTDVTGQARMLKANPTYIDYILIR